jgi:hypothetical protein
MTNKQTECTLGGITYVSKPELFHPSCEGCATYHDSELCRALPSCADLGIVWVKKIDTTE